MTLRKLNIGLTLVFFILICQTIKGQEVVKFNLWTGTAFKVKFSEHFTLKTYQQIRTKMVEQKLEKALLNFEGNYNFKKWGWASLGYRFTTRGEFLEHRWYTGFGLKHTFKDIGITVKGRIRAQFDKKAQAGEDIVGNIRLRNFIIYNPQKSALLKKFKFFWYGEVWYQITPPTHKWSRFRTGVGTTYAFSKTVNLTLVYLYENKIPPIQSAQVHMLFLQLGFKLDAQKKS